MRSALLRHSARGAIWLACTLTLGCAVASAPIQDTPLPVAEPQAGGISLIAQSRPAVGGVVPVYISVANGTDIPRAIVPSQVFALDDNGDRIAPLPPGEAARQTGNSGELKAALTSTAVSGIAAGGIGGILGAAVGTAFGAAGEGAALGGGIAGGQAMLAGAPAGATESKNQANQQINAIALQGADISKNFTASGYVFFPQGSYTQIELLLVNRETGDTETIKQPWR
jgi:hypothetical protein